MLYYTFNFNRKFNYNQRNIFNEILFVRNKIHVKYEL